MLSKYSVKKPYTVIVAVIIVLILGTVAFTGMQLDLLPNINLPYAIVMTSYTGASPEEVETVVTKPLEQAMSTVSNIKNVSSVSSENSSMVILEFNQDTDMNTAANEMRERIDMVTPYWEDDQIGSPMIMQINPDMIPVMVASVDMDDMTAGEFSAFVSNKLMSQLESIEGVASVTAYGLGENRIDVTIDDGLIDDINEVIAASINGDIGKAKAMLNSARAQIEAAYAQLDAVAAENTEQLDAAESQISAGLSQLNEEKEGLTKGITALTSEQTALSGALSDLNAEKEDLNAQIKTYTDQGQPVPAALTEQLAAVNTAISEKETALGEVNGKLTESQAALGEIETQIAALNDQQKAVDSGRAALEEQLGSAESQLDAGLSQINSHSGQLSSAAAAAKKKADIKNYITKEMISGILAAQNFSMPAGILEAAEGDYAVKVGKALTSIDDIKNLLLFELDIDGVDDIRVKDVALVATADADESYTKVNGNNGILLSFEKQSEYSATEVSENISKAMVSLEKDHPGLHYYDFMDQGEYIKILVNNVLHNLLMGAALAILVLMLCLKDLRPTLIVAISIPASLLFALVAMYFTGVTLNLISLSGLALGVGMLVDDSIVVIENIYRMRRQGIPAKEAAVAGTKQVIGAITASTLTTISVFVPVLFTRGMSKDLFMDMGLTIAYSLLASLLVAVTVVPSMASRTLEHASNKESKVFDWLKARYEAAVRWSLKRRALTMILITVLLFGSAALSISRGFSFMPDYTSTELTATLTTEKEDLSDKDFYAAADDVTAAALKVEGVSGVGSMSSNADTSYAAMASNVQSISFYLVLDEDAPADSDELKKVMAAAAAEHDCELDMENSNNFMAYLGGTGVTLTVKGEDLSAMSSFTKGLGDAVAEVDGVAEVTTDMEHPTAQLMVTVDKDKAMKEGLTVSQVYMAVSQDIAADKAATTVMVDGSEYAVFVIDGGEEKMSINDVSDIVVDEESDIIVGDIAAVEEEDSPASIYRDGQQRYMTITATVSDSYAISKVSDAVEKCADQYETPAGISVEVGGESTTVNEYMTDLVKAIAMAILLMYLIMVAEFQSLRSPFIVMFTIPLAFTGGFLALFLTGFDVSVIALLGFLVLSGIVVKNGIVLVDFVNILVDSGMDTTEALIEGGKTRLRPIIMTALTTVLALVTLALGIGSGAEMVQPMAIVTIGGLVYATVLTLIVVPVMYDLLHRKRIRKRRGKETQSGGKTVEALTETIQGVQDAQDMNEPQLFSESPKDTERE
ncbi:MAG TPA: efflux RND transporter permease subunit [Clostridiales bacterium]|nr:efflux RND transporter permease subunit [Clostridiales bacterium]